MLALPNWSPHPRESPVGCAGVFLVLAFLLLSLADAHGSPGGVALRTVIFLSGVGLCLFSLVREKSKLYGYTGIFGTVLYLAGNVMALLVGPGR